MESTKTSASLLKSLLKGTALYSVALFGQRIAGLLLLPVNTHFLDPADYGVLGLLEQIGVVTSVLLGLNISAALGYFYFKGETKEARDNTVGTVLIGGLLAGILAGIVGVVFAEPIGRIAFGNNDYKIFLLFVFLSMPFSAVLEALFSWLRVSDRPEVFATASLLRVGITVVMTLLLVAGLKMRVLGVLTSSFTAIVLPAVVLTIYLLRRQTLRFDPGLFVQVFRFSFPIGLASIAMFVINFGDLFVLRHYRSLAEVGIYGVAYKIGMLMSFIHASFHTYWSSQVYDVARREDADFVIPRIFTYMMLVLSIAALSLVVLCRPAVAILISRPGFAPAALVAPLIVAAYYLRAIGDFFRCFFLIEGRSSYDAACTWIGLVICIAGYALLIPRYGMWGAAIATLLTFLAITAISAAWAYRIHPYRVEGIRLAKIGAVSAGLLAAYFAVPLASVVAQIAWALLLILLFPAALWAIRFPQPGEMAKLGSLLAAARQRYGRFLRGPRTALP